MVGVDEVPVDTPCPEGVVGGDRLGIELHGERSAVPRLANPAHHRVDAVVDVAAACRVLAGRDVVAPRHPDDVGQVTKALRHLAAVLVALLDRLGDEGMSDGPTVDRVEHDRDAVLGGHPQVRRHPLPVRLLPLEDVAVHEGEQPIERGAVIAGRAVGCSLRSTRRWPR